MKSQSYLRTFCFFEDIEAVMGGRVSVTPVHLLNSADAPDPSTSSRTSTPVSADSRTNTPVPLESKTSTPVSLESRTSTLVALESRISTPVNLESTPDPYADINEETSCLSPAQPSGPSNIHKDTSGPSRRHSQPSGTSASHMEPSTVSHSEPSGTPISKKKRKRPNKLSKAEASARALIREIVEGKEKSKRR